MKQSAKRPEWLKSKWIKTQVLSRNQSIRPLIPRTEILTKHSLHSMLQAYHMVYLKPDNGTWGKGILKVRQTKQRYVLHTNHSSTSYSTYDELYHGIKRIIKSRRFLVQKGIELLKHRGRRFDLRVMVQRNPRREWETTGIVGRLGHPKRIVTNFHNGGKAMEADTLLSSHMSKTHRVRFKRRLRNIGVVAARQLASRYSGLQAAGIDIAIDDRHIPYILEINTRPDKYIFNAIPNKAMFRKIMRYARAKRRKPTH